MRRMSMVIINWDQEIIIVIGSCWKSTCTCESLEEPRKKHSHQVKLMEMKRFIFETNEHLLLHITNMLQHLRACMKFNTHYEICAMLNKEKGWYRMLVKCKQCQLKIED